MSPLTKKGVEMPKEKKVPKGYHRMPNGKIMKGKTHKKTSHYRTD